MPKEVNSLKQFEQNFMDVKDKLRQLRNLKELAQADDSCGELKIRLCGRATTANVSTEKFLKLVEEELRETLCEVERSEKDYDTVLSVARSIRFGK